MAPFHWVNSPPPHTHFYLLLSLICKFLASPKLLSVTGNFPVCFKFCSDWWFFVFFSLSLSRASVFGIRIVPVTPSQKQRTLRLTGCLFQKGKGECFRPLKPYACLQAQVSPPQPGWFGGKRNIWDLA